MAFVVSVKLLKRYITHPVGGVGPNGGGLGFERSFKIAPRLTRRLPEGVKIGKPSKITRRIRLNAWGGHSHPNRNASDQSILLGDE